jgi:hypothetical protein
MYFLLFGKSGAWGPSIGLVQGYTPFERMFRLLIHNQQAGRTGWFTKKTFSFILSKIRPHHEG